MSYTYPYSSLDSSYHVGEPSFEKTVVCSRKRFTYEEAQKESDDPTAPFSSQFQDAYLAAVNLWSIRLEHGAITSYDLENGWVTTEDGVRILLDAEKRFVTYLMEQEFIILANQVIASTLAVRALPALYRNHVVVDPQRKATYSPNISGHGGLNVSAYIHALFPLRSYPDLVNQRILLAQLRGEPSPYTTSELEDLALTFNAKERGIKAEKRWHFRGEYDGILQTALEKVPLVSLDQKHFHTVIRKAAEEQSLTPEIEQEILRRLKQQLLKENDLYTLIFRFPNSAQEWQQIKQAVFSILQKKPAYASMVFNTGQQQGKWFMRRYEQPFTSPGYYQARVSLDYLEQTYTSALYTAEKKERAKQLAILDVLATIAGVVLSSPEVSAPESQAVFSDGEEGT
ncbi:hypothetical protein KDW_31050 [Dictyobacter vulcani]|uniref:RNB domain-containing protein n=1 Tax=Dictyobacter vulcani TaxID=2607529 RepID=A0A5J4KMH9_9CHLR|nr:RNB domain-containing ribonuclease [Dictyobacter vulcani]GER88943.1 hypothetical protein KDW_31050 [Dictyobacter vulcani]